ncbi:YIP1 family protein [bacterium]|nr:YIP1 family protein [bacterium]MBU1651224.1 YIP1 family protein [bacterium]MBU1881652.1 YIP1 family protein [bacterium]
MENETNNLQQEAPQLNVMQRITGIFTSPQNTLEDIAGKPTWMVPLIITVLATVLITYALVPVLISDMQSSDQWQEMLSNPDLSVEQIEQMQSVQLKVVRNFSGAGAGAGVIFYTLLVSAILLFVANILMGGHAKYAEVFSVFTWTGLVGVIGSIVRMFLASSAGTMEVYLSPAILMSGTAEETFLFKFLAGLDVFIIWRVILMAIGLTAIYKFSFTKSFVTLALLYLLMMTVTIFLGGAISG